MNVLMALCICLTMLYAWAGLHYVFLRFRRPETEAHLRAFLEEQFQFFTFRLFG
jgi:hypothetical protein